MGGYRRDNVMMKGKLLNQVSAAIMVSLSPCADLAAQDCRQPDILARVSTTGTSISINNLGEDYLRYFDLCAKAKQISLNEFLEMCQRSLELNPEVAKKWAKYSQNERQGITAAFGKENAKVFHEMDKNADNILTRDEFLNYYGARLVEMDQNHDGSLDINEMKAYMGQKLASLHKQIQRLSEDLAEIDKMGPQIAATEPGLMQKLKESDEAYKTIQHESKALNQHMTKAMKSRQPTVKASPLIESSAPSTQTPAEIISGAQQSELETALLHARAVPFFREYRQAGLRIFAIQAGSWWEKIGLINGDIITLVDGIPARDNLSDAFGSMFRSPDNPHEVTLERFRTTVTLKVEPGK